MTKKKSEPNEPIIKYRMTTIGDELKNQHYKIENLEKILSCMRNGHNWEYNICSRELRRTCSRCGRSDSGNYNVAKILRKIEKLFKNLER